MFSYGMVLYELLSGRRPTLGHHQLQTAKKLSKGIRPVLGSPEEVQFCCLHSLLIECWDTKPEKVSGEVGNAFKALQKNHFKDIHPPPQKTQGGYLKLPTAIPVIKVGHVCAGEACEGIMTYGMM